MDGRQHIVDLLHREPPADGLAVATAGWVRSRRDSKAGVSFIDLADGSSLTGLQVVAPAEMADYEAVVPQLHIGASIWVEGRLVPSQGRGQRVEVQAETIRLLGGVDPEAYPIQKQKMSLEHLRTIPHLRARTRTFQAVMRLRSILAHAVHRFFQDRGFYYVHTPIISHSDCEGAGAMFRVTTLPADEPPRDDAGGVDFGADFFGRETFLTVSGQLEGETYACGLGDIYTFGPTFRAENSNTTRHLAEFWMIEPEMAFCDLSRNREVACDFVRFTVAQALELGSDEIDFLAKEQRKLRGDLEHLADTDFAHVSYTEAIERLQKSGKTFEFPVSWGADLQAEHERFLVEQQFRKPVVVTDYPKELKAFYMRLNDDDATVAAMDVLVPRMGELIGGAQREERLDVLQDRLQAAGLPSGAYEAYLDLRRFGSVPHAGFGLGFERLVCLVTGMQNIRDVIPFPRTPGHCP